MKKISKNKGGFSFIELMITIAIAGIMTAATLVSMNAMREKKAVEGAAREVVAVVREAQTYALTGKGLTASSASCSYIFSWASPTAIDYSIGGCLNPARSYTLKNGVQFSGSSGNVSFSVPFSTTSPANIKLSKNASDYYVCVYASGIVSESLNACETSPICGDGPCNGTETCSNCPSDCGACAPVNGGWSEWSSWGACSVSCGSGTQTAFRTCSNPLPSYGGSDCSGLNYQTQSCNTQPCPLTATGGTITYSGGYTIHTFTSSGTFNVTGSGNVEVLVVAGGGGGGKGDSAYGGGGGGGGGGYIYNTSFVVTPQSYSITVGGGGEGGAGTYIYGPIPEWNGHNGSNSVFSTLTAAGGGGGGGATLSGLSGGSGGGAGGGHNYNPSGGAGTGGQGNNGGNTNYYLNGHASGGGGQAAAGGNASASVGGNGGAGINNSISGVSVGYAGGGGSWANGTATHGGGNAMAAGTANTGGGGGGGKGNGDPQVGRAGGSGIVIVRYPTN